MVVQLFILSPGTCGHDSPSSTTMALTSHASPRGAPLPFPCGLLPPVLALGASTNANPPDSSLHHPHTVDVHARDASNSNSALKPSSSGSETPLAKAAPACRFCETDLLTREMPPPGPPVKWAEPRTVHVLLLLQPSAR